MRYTGEVGEFKLRGFIIALILCVAIALILFTRFDYVREIGPEETKTSSRAVDAELDEIRMKLQELERRVASNEARHASCGLDKGEQKQPVSTPPGATHK